MNNKEKEKLFKEFIFKNHIMIVDKSSASRKRLAKTLNDNDARMNKIHLYSRYEEALADLGEVKPAIILSDFHLGDGSGFDLFKAYREKNTPESKSAVLILITANVSQSAVAKAAEEDVDSFIIKPYTINSLTEGLVNALISKLYPSDYMKKIDEGKSLLFDSKLDEALVVFESAKEMSKKPSLACFYIGQTNYIKHIKDKAVGEFKEGITHNQIHFKCQIGLYDLYYKDKMYEQAYEIVKNIAKYFPANPDRLNNIVRLAVITKNYPDMNYYYEIFKSLEMREEETIKYICAGLFVSGKYYLINNNEDEGIALFNKIAVSAAGDTKFYRAMIEALVQYGCNNEAEKILLRYDSDEKLTQDFAISEFIISSVKENNEKVIEIGMELIKEDVEIFSVYRILLKALIKGEYEDKAKSLHQKANELFPEKSDELDEIIKPTK